MSTSKSTNLRTGSVCGELSIQTTGETVSADWVVSTNSTDSEYVASFDYETKEELVRVEYEDRVFDSVKEAEFVYDTLNQHNLLTDSLPQQKVIGNQEPQDIQETTTNIVRSCEYIQEEIQPLLTVNSNTVQGTAIKLNSLVTQCISLACTIESAALALLERNQLDRLDSTITRLRQGIRDTQRTLLELVELTEDAEGSTIKNVVFAIEQPIHRLTQIAPQTDNWRLMNSV